MNSVLLRAENVSKIRLSNKQKKLVINNINFSINRGKIIGLLGANGAVGYSPQDFVAHAQDTIAQVLDVERKIQALHAIEAGTGTAHDQLGQAKAQCAF